MKRESIEPFGEEINEDNLIPKSSTSSKNLQFKMIIPQILFLSIIL
jgi:hypothetical protein